MCGGWLESCITGQCLERVYLSNGSSWQRANTKQRWQGFVFWGTLNCKKFKPTIPITSFLMIYGLPTEQGYATLHAFRCIISASWDLIKITASKIPVKWKFWEDNTLYTLMQNVSSPSSGKIWVNLRFYGCRQKSSPILFSFDTSVVFYYMSWDHSLPRREEKNREWNTLQKMHLTLLSNIIIA